MVQCSIVVVNHNGREYLGDCLRSVLSTTDPATEIIVVDNGSTDGSPEFLKEKFPRVKMIRSRRNLGFAGANNLGILRSRGDNVILLNSDTVVTESWMETLQEEAQSNPSVGIVGPKLLLRDGRINSTGLLLNHRLCGARDRGFEEIDHGQCDEKHDILGVSFACALIKKKVLRDVGLLDEKMFLYSEDLDYCIRTRLRGYDIRYCPKSVVYHRLGASVNKMSSVRAKYNLRNRYRCLLKNYENKNVIKWGAYSLVFNLVISPIAYLRRCDLSHVIMCHYVILWNLLNLPVRERMEIQTRRVIGDDQIFKFRFPSRW